MRTEHGAGWLLSAIALGITAMSAAGASGDAVSSLNGIADLGFNHSEIAATAEYLADQIGGRMTNSPAMRKAERWTQDKFRGWGLKNVHTEAFDFGRGWWIESSHVRLIAPRTLELYGIPVAWTPPTSGALTASVFVAPMSSEKDFAQWKGKLQGKIVLVSWPAPQKDDENPPVHRYTEADIAKREPYVEGSYDPDARVKRIEKFRYAAHLDEFLAQEGAVASVKMSYREGRLVHGEGYQFRVGASAKLPQIELAAEDYRRIARLAKVGEVKLEIENKVHYEDADHNAYNVTAEIPGSDAKAGYVMAGAHLDSWVAADGAADNGAGSVMVMEAARILASLRVQPRRTMRFVLWAGEEQGLLGSAAYIDQHLARRPVPPAAEADLTPGFFADSYPIQVLPGFGELAAYFNIDNGSGKLRGIYTEGNLSVVPILREWLLPFASMGANAVVAEPTFGTDHVYMSRLGLAAFQFIQDPLDYGTRVHHSDLDTYDHLRIDDMRQGAVILASLMLRAADAEKPLPRKVLPTQSTVTDPFAYPEPTSR
jgi:carboxypeptidase Q